MKIKDVEFNTLAFLAPMAGVTDRAFRETAVNFGAAYTATEMISAKGIQMSNRESLSMLEIEKSPCPIAIQLFGDDPGIVADAAVRATEFSPDIIDINMGCPAPKIVNNGSGSALMKDAKKAGKIVREVVSKVNIPVTVKIRKGWDDDANLVNFAKTLEDAGAAAITVHGRTRAEMFKGEADLNAVKTVKRSVKIPVIGNGDITDVKKAAEMLEKTGCDAIMIGRGACGNPWLFREINAYLKDGSIIPPPTLDEKLTVMLRHIKRSVEYKGEKMAIKEARRQAAYYIKGIKNGAKYRNALSSINTYEELTEIAYMISKENK